MARENHSRKSVVTSFNHGTMQKVFEDKLRYLKNEIEKPENKEVYKRLELKAQYSITEEFLREFRSDLHKQLGITIVGVWNYGSKG